jgi:hypothetical protein
LTHWSAKHNKYYQKVHKNAWVIPIATPEGEYVSIKFHFESPPEGHPKSLWFEMGTRPKDKPVHAYTTLWPEVSWWSKPEVILEPGMLKAFAAISMGFQASGISQSESCFDEFLAEKLARRIVYIPRDPDRTGEKFVELAGHYLAGKAFKLLVYNPSEMMKGRMNERQPQES